MPPGYFDLIREGGAFVILLRGLMILASGRAAFLGYCRYTPWALLAVSLLPFCFGACCYWMSMRRLLQEQGGDIFRDQIFGWIRDFLPYLHVSAAMSVLTLIASFILYALRRPRKTTSQDITRD